MQLINSQDPANLVINQGGDALHAGQRFRAMVLGEMMTDPYTHEPLGQVEREAGVVEVKRVDAKLSYAQIVSGYLPVAGGGNAQIVLRPMLPAAPAAVRERHTAATPAAPAITKLPFDP